jgi:diguanylate cyclase (GGDEF)-like protein
VSTTFAAVGSAPRRVWETLRDSGTIRARLAVQNLVIVGLIVGVIILSSQSAAIDHQRAQVTNVAGRQPMLVHRYLAEVLLVSAGRTADPDGTFDQLQQTGRALLDGGAVLAAQGNDEMIRIGAQTDAAIRAKLTEELRLIGELGDDGKAILAARPGTPAWDHAVDVAEQTAHVTANVAHDALGAMTVHAQAAVRRTARLEMILAAIGIGATLFAGWSMSRHIVRRLDRFGEIAKATAAGDLTARYESTRRDEIGVLGDAFNDMSASLSTLVRQLEADAERDDFGRQLSEAFEMVDDELSALDVVTRAMGEAADTSKVELLLADATQPDLHAVAEHPRNGGPGCEVDSPFGCVAVRRGAATVFSSSEALNACPKLADRASGPCSAVCIPVTFMGRALGVVHATGPVDEPPAADEQHRLTTLASLSGARLGTVRAFNESQEQATTDPLTSLLNRRAVEAKLSRLVHAKAPFTLAMADLDHFKMLNDSHGHEAGDKALRQFADGLRSVTRAEDVLGRWGGEEFVAVFVGATVDEVTDILHRLRDRLAKTLASNGTPAFTSSFGLAHSTDHHGVSEIIQAADVALYRAKENGRDQVAVSRPGPPEGDAERRLMEAIASGFEDTPTAPTP